jgi:putative serine protease PepD
MSDIEQLGVFQVFTGGGTGSGFLIDKHLLITNCHVVEPFRKVAVELRDRTRVVGTVRRIHPHRDLALVELASPRTEKVFEVASSEGLEAKQTVSIIGYPVGLPLSLTEGVISHPRQLLDEQHYVQTDAAINPGNSGGPLVDAAGNVIGVNSAIARAPGSTGTTGGNIGVGFAIPSNQARRTASELISNGKAQHPILGISLDQRYDGEGVRVADAPSAAGEAPVRPGGPAAKAGIKPGDVVTAIDGRPVTTPDELIVAVRAKEVGGVAVLTVRRAGQELKISVTLAAATG